MQKINLGFTCGLTNKKKKWNSNTIRWAEKYYRVTPCTGLSDDDRQNFICDMLMMICDIRLCYLQLSSILSCCSHSRTLHISLRSHILKKKKKEMPTQPELEIDGGCRGVTGRTSRAEEDVSGFPTPCGTNEAYRRPEAAHWPTQAAAPHNWGESSLLFPSSLETKKDFFFFFSTETIQNVTKLRVQSVYELLIMWPLEVIH